ncbi:hypothetical protein LG198_00240 [Methylobacillus arboreus]|nr:hypothetical protein [Methylobacillus arboreus]
MLELHGHKIPLVFSGLAPWFHALAEAAKLDLISQKSQYSDFKTASSHNDISSLMLHQADYTQANHKSFPENPTWH